MGAKRLEGGQPSQARCLSRLCPTPNTHARARTPPLPWNTAHLVEQAGGAVVDKGGLEAFGVGHRVEGAAGGLHGLQGGKMGGVRAAPGGL